MKTVFFLITSLLTLAACTPGDKYLRSDAPAGGIEVAATDTDSHPVTITASASWMVGTTGLPEWMGVRYASDSPDLLWVEALARNESLDSLRSVVTVISGDGLRLDIPFVQLPMVVDFAVSPRTLDSFGPRETDSRTLTVASNLTWEWLSVGESDWLTVTRSADPDTGVETLTLTAAPTRELDPRRDTIVVRPVVDAFHGYADSIAVVQRGIDLVVYADAMNETTFEIEIPAAGGETALSVFSRNAWTVTASADRVTLDIAGGETDIENGIPVIITTTPNITLEPITFTLTFTAGGETYEYTCTQQGGAAPPPPPQEEQEEQQQEGNEGT